MTSYNVFGGTLNRTQTNFPKNICRNVEI